MEKTEAVKQAVEDNKIVVACAYHGWVPEEVADALPAGFQAHSFVAKFQDGQLVAIERGLPEQAMLKLLGVSESNPADPKTYEGTAASEIPRS
ncbi:MAG: hypothetical protein KDB82_01360 [Planctomycetes bacterium]|nr:hypothetical protein [Planctomycetota bacterium]